MSRNINGKQAALGVFCNVSFLVIVTAYLFPRPLTREVLFTPAGDPRLNALIVCSRRRGTKTRTSCSLFADLVQTAVCRRTCADALLKTALCIQPCAYGLVQTTLCIRPCASNLVQTALCRQPCADDLVQTALCRRPCADSLCRRPPEVELSERRQLAEIGLQLRP